MTGTRGRKDKRMHPAAASLPHVRPVRPLHFRDQEPEEERLREGERHARVCQVFHDLLTSVVPTSRCSIGADQFVYFRANDPSRCLAPDAFVKIGVPDEAFPSWKSWERGAPDVAFEILSPSDSDEPWTLDEKLERYHELGVRELVVFDVDAPAGRRLRAWDRMDGDLVERVVEHERTPCLTLGLQLTIAPAVIDAALRLPACLRLLRDDGSLELTLEEERTALERAEQAQNAEAEVSRAEAHSQRAEALARANALAAERDSAAARRRAGRS
jgi:Uma2 family endonuclease